MKMEREIISREFIKPSSPTPNHLKTHNLSLLDQIVPPIYVPLVLYFPAKENLSRTPDLIPQTTQVLKRSLSQTLTRYYPLAGRIKDRLSIDCNDEGVLFVISRIKSTLSAFLKKPDPVECRNHIACELSWAEPGPGSYVTTVQVNYFDCGGIAIGSLFLHKVTDGVAISTFMKDWAANTQNYAETEFSDIYSAMSLFPQKKEMQRENHLFSAMRQYFKIGKTVMRRYVFDSSAIFKLRDRLSSCSSGEGLKFRPSRVETVSAFLWKCFMIALAEKESKTTSLVTHGVNMRRKANPTFPEESFGNFVWLVPASSTNEPDPDLKHLVCKVRNAINNVDSDFVQSMQGDEGFSGYVHNLEESLKEFPKKAEYLAISSWCNFGLYNIDFGWGKPVWITKCDAGSDTDWSFINVIWLMDTKDKDGIEAWMTLDEQHILAFDNIKELQVFAKIDPSPLDDATFDKNKEFRAYAPIDPSPLEIAASINKSVLIN